MLNMILPLLNLVLYDLLFLLKVVFEVLELRNEHHRETLNSVYC